MTKECQKIIALIESNKEKSRKIDSIDNIMELAYLIALCEVNELHRDEEVSQYIHELTDLRHKETDLRIQRRIKEIKEIQGNA